MSSERESFVEKLASVLNQAAYDSFHARFRKFKEHGRETVLTRSALFRDAKQIFGGDEALLAEFKDRLHETSLVYLDACRDQVTGSKGEALTEFTAPKEPEPEPQNTSSMHVTSQSGSSLGPGTIPGSAIRTFNVWVGDLTKDANEDDLRAAFGHCGVITDARVIRDRRTGNNSKGFGFVHFENAEAQAMALAADAAKSIYIKGKCVRVSAGERKTTLFVGNMPIDMTDVELRDALEEAAMPFVSLDLKKTAPPESRSRGFCFVEYDTHSAADKARKMLLLANIRGRKPNVDWAETRKPEDERVMSQVKTIFIKNISMECKETELQAEFEQFGEVEKVILVKHPETGLPKGFGFVEFADRQSALNAIREADNRVFQGCQLSVALARPPDKKNKENRDTPMMRGGRGGRHGSPPLDNRRRRSTDGGYGGYGGYEDDGWGRRDWSSNQWSRGPWGSSRGTGGGGGGGGWRDPYYDEGSQGGGRYGGGGGGDGGGGWGNAPTGSPPPAWGARGDNGGGGGGAGSGHWTGLGPNGGGSSGGAGGASTWSGGSSNSSGGGGGNSWGPSSSGYNSGGSAPPPYAYNSGGSYPPPDAPFVGGPTGAPPPSRNYGGPPPADSSFRPAPQGSQYRGQGRFAPY